MTETSTDVLPAEAQELEATGHYVTAALDGNPMEVVPPGAWRQSAMRKLKAGDMDEFMEEILSPSSYDQYLDINPTNDSVGLFIEDAGAVSGEQLGKSSGPKGSSRNTRKR